MKILSPKAVRIKLSVHQMSNFVYKVKQINQAVYGRQRATQTFCFTILSRTIKFVYTLIFNDEHFKNFSVWSTQNI